MKLRFCDWVVLGSMLIHSGCAALPALPSLLSPPKSSEGFLNSTSVEQRQANFRVVKPNVVGTAKGFKLLGIIGIKPANYSKAMTQLYANGEMTEGRSQTWANVVYEKSSSYYILFSISRVTVRADLIEFTQSPPHVKDNPNPPADR